MDSQPRRAHYFAKQSIVCYTLLISHLFCFLFDSKVFSTLCTEKHSWKNHFQLVSDFIFCLLLFIFSPFLFLRVHKKINYLPTYIGKFQSLCGGVSQKFLPLTIIGKSWAVCRGVSRKFYEKIAEKFSRQPQIKRKSDIAQTSFSIFIILSLKIKGYNLLFHKTHNYVYWNTICYSIDNVP